MHFISLVTQMLKHLPAMWETRVWFLGREDSLEKEMAIHSSTLAWKIPWTEEPDRLQSMGSQRVGHDWATSLASHLIQSKRSTWHSKPRRFYSRTAPFTFVAKSPARFQRRLTVLASWLKGLISPQSFHMIGQRDPCPTVRCRRSSWCQRRGGLSQKHKTNLS